MDIVNKLIKRNIYSIQNELLENKEKKIGQKSILLQEYRQNISALLKFWYEIRCILNIRKIIISFMR